MIIGHNPAATLWLLAYDGITAGTHISIIDELRGWPTLAHSVLPGESLLDRVRSRVASMFLLTDRTTAGDVLLFVDSDISWRQGDLAHIARRALERDAIIGGIYPKRTFCEGSAVRFARGLEGSWRIGTDNLMPCEYVGNGFIAIPRSIVKAVADTMPWVRETGAVNGGYWPVFLSQVVDATYDGEGGNEFLPEDYSFQHRAKALGYQCFADTYPRLTHEGHYRYRLVDALTRPPQDEDITITLSSAAYAARGA